MNPKRARQAAFALLLLISAFAFGLVLFHQSPPSKGSNPPASLATPGLPQKADPELTRQALAIEAKVREEDKTLWAPEMAAQNYEAAIARLWDDLRNAPDPYAV